MHESVLTKGTENSLTFCLHEVMQSLKVKEKMGHIFTAQGSFAGHQNLKNPILTAPKQRKVNLTSLLDMGGGGGGGVF